MTDILKAIDLLKVTNHTITDALDNTTDAEQARRLVRAAWLVSKAQEELENIGGM